MADPAFDIYDPEDTKDTQSSLRSLEGDPNRPSLKVINGGQTTGASPNSTEESHLQELDDGHTDGTSQADSKASPAPDNDFKYSDGDQATKSRPSGRIQNFFWSTKKRKASSIGGGTGLLGIAIGIFMIVSIGSGPFEIIHMAQVLTQSHFSDISDAANQRFSKELYVMARGGSLNSGDTRLGWIAFYFKNQIMDTMKDAGITFDTTSSNTLKGLALDTTKPGTLYSGLDDEAVLTALKTDYPNLNITNPSDGEFYLTPGGNKFIQATIGDSQLINAAVDIANPNAGKISNFLRVRVLNRYFDAEAWHIFSRAQADTEQAINDKTSTWLTNLKKFFSSGSEPLSETPGTNSSGEEEESTPTPDGVVPDGETNSLLANLGSIKGKVAGVGLAVLSAIVCALDEIDKNIGIIRYAQVISPMERMATTVISAGSQVMSGQDIDMNEVSELSQQFNSVNSQGQVTSNWSDAAPIQSETGGSGDIDLDQSTKDLFSGSPSWLSWTQSGIVQTFCSTAVQAGAFILSFALNFTPGGIIFNILTLAAGAIATPKIVSAADSILAGQAINVNASGAEFGNYVDYGARLAANSDALQYGGTALTSSQSAQLSAQSQSENLKQFESESLADRLFNISDYRSLVGSLIDKLNPNGWQTIASLAGDIPSIFGSIIKMPASLVTATGLAATPSYQYPFPEIGFSEQDLDNPLVQDPNTNAMDVGQLLSSSPLSQQYINLALDCFGIDLYNGPQGWDAVPTTQNPTDSGFTSQYLDRTYGVDPYDPSNYNQSECQNGLPGDSPNNWLQIRFFIFDTGVMEGYACYLGDNTSCSNDGFTSASLVSGSEGVSNGS